MNYLKRMRQNMITSKNNYDKPVIYCDFHTHTGFSDDCDVPADKMIQGAVNAGIRTLAVTDHHDPGYPDPDFPFILNIDSYYPFMKNAQERYRDQIEILIGMEIGIMKGQYDKAEEYINRYPFDIIIGSFHCMRNNDMYRFDFSKADTGFLLRDFYEYMYECLSEFDNYDIVGHFSIMDRYIGRIYDYSPYSDVIDEILRLLVKNGKGLEINTSSFKYGTDSWLPRESILKRYLELGGEILTFGSDAHSPEYYMYHFRDAVEFAKFLGFKYYCQFRARKPEFLPLP